jgi:hypothetical protein
MATCTVFELCNLLITITVCSDKYFGTLQTTNYFYRRHNTTDVRTSLQVTRLLTEIFGILVLFTAMKF